jgi:hypothetical protein
MTLKELAIKHGTDKEGAHHYTEAYERHIGHLKHEPINLLEVGVGGYNVKGEGAHSLRMWKEWMPSANIIGLDIEDKTDLAEDRIAIFKGDQTDKELLCEIAGVEGGLEVVIDDGSHVPALTLKTLAILFPKLNPGGIYVIEDCQTSYWPEWGGQVDPWARETLMHGLFGLCHGMNHPEYRFPHEPSYFDVQVEQVAFLHNMCFIWKKRLRAHPGAS